MAGKKPCKDHTGRPFSSVPDMCLHYGIPPSTYTGRLSRGWTVEQALTTPTKGNGAKVKKRGRRVTDHAGMEHESIAAMCRYWDIPEKVYWSRKRIMKWPLDKILTTPVADPKDTANAKPATDHEGTAFKSISAMCRHWGISLTTYRERRRRGWDIGKSLTEKEAPVQIGAIQCRDHKGNEYPSKAAMCSAYGITRHCYESRRDAGWSKKRALTEKIVVNAKPCTGLNGERFPASVYMAGYYGLPAYALHSADSHGANIEKLASHYWNGRDCGPYQAIRPISFPWFLAVSKYGKVVLHFDAILSAYHEHEMAPLPDTRAANPYIQVVRRIRWPWYLCEIDGEGPAVLGYWDLIRRHAASNYGLSRPR